MILKTNFTAVWPSQMIWTFTITAGLKLQLQLLNFEYEKEIFPFLNLTKLSSVFTLSHAPRVWRLWTSATTLSVMKGSTSWKTGWLPTALCSDWALLPPNCPAKVASSTSASVQLLIWIFKFLISDTFLCYRCCGCGWIYCWEPQAAASGPSREWN